MVAIRMSLLHGLGSVNFDHSVGKSDGHKLTISRICDVVSEEFGIEFDFLKNLFSLDVDDSQKVGICVSDNAFLRWIDSKVDNFLVFLHLIRKVRV